MQVQAINTFNNQQTFKGQFKLNPQNMDIFDLNLLKYKSEDIVDFVQKQKYDYTVSKAFNEMYVAIEEKGKQIDEYMVEKYKDRNGNRSLERIFDTIKKITKDTIDKNIGK